MVSRCIGSNGFYPSLIELREELKGFSFLHAYARNKKVWLEKMSSLILDYSNDAFTPNQKEAVCVK